MISSIFILLEFKNSNNNITSLSKFFLLLRYSLVYDLLFEMILKYILSFPASIIKFFIIFIFSFNSIADDDFSKYFIEDKGTVSLMYHRFNEDKYPSTNIQMDIFEKHINIIKSKNLEFENIEKFALDFSKNKDKKKILITIDDAFSSFYYNAWPFLKKNKIPFILFVSTEPIGKNGYMNWSEIKEVEKSEFGYIGNHSHSHEYLVNYKFEDFKKDIDKSIEIFKENLGYNPVYFSYPFGEYSKKQRDYISKNFKFAFGQHSGVIDFNKNRYELPRFPINEKYGDLERFKFLISLLPLQYKKLEPEDKFIKKGNNPPDLSIEFFKEQKNIKNINCFSDEGENWKKSKIKFEENKMYIKFIDKFKFRRGRINCSLNDNNKWRWLGIQFSIEN